MKYFLAIVAICISASAMAALWVGKPIQCDTAESVKQLMIERKQTPLFAGVGVVKIDDSMFHLPIIVFANTEDGSWHVVEYNLPQNQVCIVSFGEKLDFTAADWYFPEEKGM